MLGKKLVEKKTHCGAVINRPRSIKSNVKMFKGNISSSDEDYSEESSDDDKLSKTYKSIQQFKMKQKMLTEEIDVQKITVNSFTGEFADEKNMLRKPETSEKNIDTDEKVIESETQRMNDNDINTEAKKTLSEIKSETQVYPEKLSSSFKKKVHYYDVEINNSMSEKNVNQKTFFDANIDNPYNSNSIIEERVNSTHSMPQLHEIEKSSCEKNISEKNSYEKNGLESPRFDQKSYSRPTDSTKKDEPVLDKASLTSESKSKCLYQNDCQNNRAHSLNYSNTEFTKKNITQKANSISNNPRLLSVEKTEK